MGVLDYKLNPFNGKQFSDEYMALKSKWSLLPAYKDSQLYVDAINKNNVLLIRSGTGSGKTVLIPKYAVHALNYEKKVVVTLPKKLITRSSAEYSAKTLDVTLGEEVGYQYKGTNVKSDKTKLLYSTDGSIVSMLEKDRMLPGIDVVIIDEAHERKSNIDLMLFYLRETLTLRKEFKLIIMSASINPKPFENYFKDYKFKLLDISGKPNYPIQSQWLKEPVDERQVINKGIGIIEKIIKDGKKGDILFFVPSISDTHSVCALIADRANVTCNEVYSGVNLDKIMGATANNKLYVATPVAESSITLDGIGFVIDSGLEISTTFNSKHNAEEFHKNFITQAQVTQRKGRAGRTSSGVCFHLYTEEQYKKMDEYPNAEIHRIELVDIILKMLIKRRDINKVREDLNNFIEPPPSRNIENAFKVMKNNYYTNNNDITQLGVLVAGIPVQHYMATAIIIASFNNCIHEIIAITAMCETIKYNIKNLFMAKKDQLDKAIKGFKGTSDHLVLLKIFNTWYDMDQSKRYDWCNSKKISCNVLREVKHLIHDIRRKVLDLNLSQYDITKLGYGKFNNNDSLTRTKITLWLALSDKVFKKKDKLSIDKHTFVSNTYTDAIYTTSFIMNSGDITRSIVTHIKNMPTAYES